MARNKQRRPVNPRSGQTYYQDAVSKIKDDKLRAQLELDAYRGGYSEAQLRDLRRSLAKRANQRIRRLESAYSAVTGESYASYGSAELVKEYLRGKKRYSETLNYGDINKVRADIFSMQTFLASSSSTVSGQRKAEEARVKLFTEGGWGSDGQGKALQFASNKEFYDFLSSNVFKELQRLGFTSEQLVEKWDTVRERYKRGSSAQKKFVEAYEAFKAQQVAPTLKNLDSIVGIKAIKKRGK